MPVVPPTLEAERKGSSLQEFETGLGNIVRPSQKGSKHGSQCGWNIWGWIGDEVRGQIVRSSQILVMTVAFGLSDIDGSHLGL
jgi:hypothetical protein